MNAPIRVILGVTSRIRSTGRWRETQTLTEPFFLETDQDSFDTDIDLFLLTVWTYVNSRRAESLELQIQYAVRLENITAAAVSKGSWVQAKQNINGTLSDGDIGASDTLRDKLTEAVSVVTHNAKYDS